MTSLTQKQANVLAYIDRHTRRVTVAPDVREIAEATGRSRTAAHALVAQLAKRGAIKHHKYSHRAIELL